MKHLLSLVVLAGVSSALAQAPAVPAISAPPRSLAVPAISAPPQSPPAAPAPRPTISPYDGDAWGQFMAEYHAVKKYNKKRVIRLSDKWAKPNVVSPYKMEIVGEDEEFIYLRNIPIENPESPSHQSWLYHEAVETNLSVIKEREEKYFILDPFAPLLPPPFTDRLRLDERSVGLPSSGKWQMGFAHGDLNGDGYEDLVFPPPRTGSGHPYVFLQTGNGWQEWEAARWPEVRLDYGDAGLADFDGDGHLDIVLACHFLRNYVLYGNGKGDFTRIVELPSVNSGVTSRALEVADLDGDGRLDIVFLSELDIVMGSNEQIGSGLLVACLNTASGWRAVEASGGRPNLFGDQLAVGDFDADGDRDILTSSNKNINRYLVFLNGGNGQTWTPVALDEFPFRAYVLGVAAGRLDTVSGDEAVMAFHQKIQSGSLSFPRNGIAIYGFSTGENGLQMRERRMVDIDAAEGGKYSCAEVGDLDGDGLLDVVVGRVDGAVRVFLQSLDGAFMEERGSEIKLGPVWVNSVRILDLAKGGPRALVVSTSDAGNKDGVGAVRCFVVRRNT
jgi:hypothetical protein